MSLTDRVAALEAKLNALDSSATPRTIDSRIRTDTEINNLIDAKITNFKTEAQINTLIDNKIGTFRTEAQIGTQIDTKITSHIEARHRTVGSPTEGSGDDSGDDHDDEHGDGHGDDDPNSGSGEGHGDGDDDHGDDHHGPSVPLSDNAPSPPAPPAPTPGGAPIPPLPEFPAAPGSMGGYPTVPAAGSLPGFTMGTAGSEYRWVGENLTQVIVGTATQMVGVDSVLHVNANKFERVGGTVTHDYFTDFNLNVTVNETIHVDGNYHKVVKGSYHLDEGPIVWHWDPGIRGHTVIGIAHDHYLGGKLYHYVPFAHHQIEGLESVLILGGKTEKITSFLVHAVPEAKHVHGSYLKAFGRALYKGTGVHKIHTTLMKRKAAKIEEEAAQLRAECDHVSNTFKDYDAKVLGSWYTKANEMKAEASKIQSKASQIEEKGSKWVACGTVEAKS